MTVSRIVKTGDRVTGVELSSGDVLEAQLLCRVLTLQPPIVTYWVIETLKPDRRAA